ncbi:MAG: hypothetical protein ACR2MS_04595 [Weeksellaceae bacterium]
MKLKTFTFLTLLSLFTSCSLVFVDRMEKLKPINEYSTENIKINSKKAIDAKITFINNETVNTKIQAIQNKNGSFDALLVTSYLAIYDRNGKRNFLKNTVIKKMVITDSNNYERIFINRENYPKSLHEQIYDGKVKWYIEYGTNPYDYRTTNTNYFVNEDGREIIVGQYNNMKKKLKQFTDSKPELAEQIDTMQINHKNILELLKKYEK